MKQYKKITCIYLYAGNYCKYKGPYSDEHTYDDLIPLKQAIEEMKNKGWEFTHIDEASHILHKRLVWFVKKEKEK